MQEPKVWDAVSRPGSGFPPTQRDHWEQLARTPVLARVQSYVCLPQVFIPPGAREAATLSPVNQEGSPVRRADRTGPKRPGESS